MTSLRAGAIGDERQKYRSFWDQFSGRADNSAMMLNANADQIEALDRENILALLPPVKGKFVADIGAGIGRFTTVFAQLEASKVVATDFVPSFVDKNRERNSAYANFVEWRVGDATGLQFDEGSVDLVFTNWLLMYMSDQEAVQFVVNALQWLRPEGYLHLRESCSEPSTKKSAESEKRSVNETAANCDTKGTGSTTPSSSSLHSKSKPNPTRYRFSSAYIELLRSVRFADAETGTQWRFDVQWACSVGVYIERQSNWRQVHWLAKKVPVATDNIGKEISLPKCVATLAKQFADHWPEEQLKFDRQMDEQKQGWMQNMMWKCIQDIKLSGDGIVFGFSGRQTLKEFGVDAQALAKHFGRRVWVVDTNPFAYRNALTCANKCADHRVRHAWHTNFDSALDFWYNVGQGMPMFSAVIGTELLAQLQDEQMFNKFTQLIQNGAYFATVEVMDANQIEDKKFKNILDLLRCQFVVDQQIHQSENGIKFLVIKATKNYLTSSKNIDDAFVTEKVGKRHLLMGGF